VIIFADYVPSSVQLQHELLNTPQVAANGCVTATEQATTRRPDQILVIRATEKVASSVQKGVLETELTVDEFVVGEPLTSISLTNFQPGVCKSFDINQLQTPAFNGIQYAAKSDSGPGGRWLKILSPKSNSAFRIELMK